MELPVWLKISLLVVILIAQTGWLLNLIKRIAQAMGIYKTDEQLARIFLEKERLRPQASVFDENAYKEQLRTQWVDELKEAQAARERIYQEEMRRREDLKRQHDYRDVTPPTKRLNSPLKLLSFKRNFKD